MHLLFVGDGPRDSATVPPLVDTILKTRVEPKGRAWKEIELAHGSGYHRKLLFAFAAARTLGLDGVVATVDRDTAPARHRLSELQRARNEDRCKPLPILPTAVGEANPKGEAWLLDDEKAVRAVLRLPTSTDIPKVLRVDPKSALHGLIELSERSERPIELLAEIAASVQIDRCTHARDTGLEEFVEEVELELRPLLPAK